jgi:hypothetical protein
MPFLRMIALCLMTVASAAHGQASSSVNKDGTKPRPDPQPFYTPYTGPGFGNPDADQRNTQPIGKSRKQYHDAAGTSAYSKGGNTEVTPLGPPSNKPRRWKKEKSSAESAGATPASPPAGEKQR